MTGFIFILFVAVLIATGIISFLVWTVRSIIRRKYRLSAMLFIILVILVLCIKFAGDILGRISDEMYIKSVFSVTTELGTCIYSYWEPCDFSGDGYSFLVYPLPNEIKRRFLNESSMLCQSFPQDKERSSTLHWQRIPVPDNYKFHIKHALYIPSEDPQFTLNFNDFQTALNTEGNYIALFYRNSNERQEHRVELFLVDLVKNKIYEVYYQ